jgi:bacterioferritin
MQGDPQVIQHLQAQLRNELTATNQYFLHYRILKHWGFDRLAKKEYEESIGEMKHADRLMERILMLDGLPNLQDLGKLLVGEDVPEILGCDLRSERGAQAAVREGSATSSSTSCAIPRSTSTSWKPSSTCSRRWVCRTTCSPRWKTRASPRRAPGCGPSRTRRRATPTAGRPSAATARRRRCLRRGPRWPGATTHCRCPAPAPLR